MTRVGVHVRVSVCMYVYIDVGVILYGMYIFMTNTYTSIFQCLDTISYIYM